MCDSSKYLSHPRESHWRVWGWGLRGGEVFFLLMVGEGLFSETTQSTVICLICEVISLVFFTL